MKTLFYYYCLLRYGEPVEMDNVNLADSEIDPEEYREPFMQKLPRRKRGDDEQGYTQTSSGQQAAYWSVRKL